MINWKPYATKEIVTWSPNFAADALSALSQLHGDSQAKIQRILQMVSGGGLSITSSHLLCGDFLYSGHTVMLTLTYLFIKECEYSKQHLFICGLHETILVNFPWIIYKHLGLHWHVLPLSLVLWSVVYLIAC